MVTKDIFSFATMTAGFKEAFMACMRFSHYIDENELSSENMHLPIIFGKEEQISFPNL